MSSTVLYVIIKYILYIIYNIISIICKFDDCNPKKDGALAPLFYYQNWDLMGLAKNPNLATARMVRA